MHAGIPANAVGGSQRFSAIHDCHGRPCTEPSGHCRLFIDPSEWPPRTNRTDFDQL